MIPDFVRDFMRGPLSAATASRDVSLQSNVIRVFGVQLHPDWTRVTFYIPDAGAEQIIKNFEDNGRVALTMSCPGTNDSYQLKGKFVSWRRNNEQDDKYVDGYRTAMIEYVSKNMGFPEDFIAAASAFKCKPTLAITFDVESVFGQSPHPDTGKLIC